MTVSGPLLIRDLRQAWGPEAGHSAVAWIDLPATLYALAVVESGLGRNLPANDEKTEPDGSISVGLWQVNQSPEWVAHHGGVMTPFPNSNLPDQIAAIHPLVTGLIDTLNRTHHAIVDRIMSGEKNIHFNPIFDGPLFASIFWQFGPRPLTEWVHKPNSSLGEDGFLAWWHETHGDLPKGVTKDDFVRRQRDMRAAYATVLDVSAVSRAVVKLSFATGIDFYSGLRSGANALAELTGIPQTKVWFDRETERFQDGFNAILEKSGKAMISAFEDAVRSAAGEAAFFVAVGLVILGVFVYMSSRKVKAIAG